MCDTNKLYWLAPQTGLEPVTIRLTGERTTDCATEEYVRENRQLNDHYYRTRIASVYPGRAYHKT